MRQNGMAKQQQYNPRPGNRNRRWRTQHVWCVRNQQTAGKRNVRQNKVAAERQQRMRSVMGTQNPNVYNEQQRVNET